MYLRESRQKRSDGTTVTHLQLAKSVWDRASRQSRTRIVYSFGRGDDAATIERLRELARSIPPDDTVTGTKLAGSKTYKAPRKRGHSKNGREDAPQSVIGLAVTRDGLPLQCRWARNRRDGGGPVRTVEDGGPL